MSAYAFIFPLMFTPFAFSTFCSSSSCCFFWFYLENLASLKPFVFNFAAYAKHRGLLGNVRKGVLVRVSLIFHCLYQLIRSYGFILFHIFGHNKLTIEHIGFGIGSWLILLP